MGRTLMTFAFVAALALGVTACKEKTAYEKASDAIKSTGTAVKDTAKDAGKAVDNAETAAVYTCRMHPEVQQSTPGNCPKCGMKLVPKAAVVPKP